MRFTKSAWALAFERRCDLNRSLTGQGLLQAGWSLSPVEGWMPEEELQAQSYWEERLSANLGLTTVGHAGLGYAYNAWLYRARYRALRRTLAVTGIDARNYKLLWMDNKPL